MACGGVGERARRVAVVVMGDVGRSPRMQYHALALAEAGVAVDLVGYAGRPLFPGLRAHQNVTCHRVRVGAFGARHRLPRVLFLAYAAARLLRQVTTLGWVLAMRLPRPDVVLVQTPPAIPTLLVALLVARTRGARLLVDWHNFGDTMLALTLGEVHPVVRLAGRHEGAVGRRADGHLCVSRAMQAALAARWGIEAHVLYDRPATAFAPTAAADRRDLCRRLADVLDGYVPDAPDRPALVVSSTSWTADEDFSLLLDAASRYDALVADPSSRPGQGPEARLLIVITGDGPLRARFEAEVGARGLRAVRVRTVWLQPEDYPRLLGAADLGICLHRSSSGVDLPMKVADMFGAGLPVCAYDYGPCLREMIRPGENGLLFADGVGLAEHLHQLLAGFPRTTARLDALRQGVQAERTVTWGEGWRAEALPLLRRLLAERSAAEEATGS